MNQITIDLSDPQLAEAFADCKPGDTKTLDAVTITVTKSGKVLQADISNLDYDGYNYVIEDEAEAPMEAAPAKKPTRKPAPPVEAPADDETA